MLVSTEELAGFLLNGAIVGPSKGNRLEENVKEELLRLEFDAKLKRHGLEVKLVVPPAQNSDRNAHPVPSLTKAVERALSWSELIVPGKACSVRALAGQAGLDKVYVRRILKCAYLCHPNRLKDRRGTDQLRKDAKRVRQPDRG